MSSSHLERIITMDSFEHEPIKVNIKKQGNNEEASTSKKRKIHVDVSLVKKKVNNVKPFTVKITPNCYMRLVKVRKKYYVTLTRIIGNCVNNFYIAAADILVYKQALDLMVEHLEKSCPHLLSYKGI